MAISLIGIERSIATTIAFLLLFPFPLLKKKTTLVPLLPITLILAFGLNIKIYFIHIKKKGYLVS